MPSKKRIAVVGSGISGIVAAHILQRRHNVTLLEKNSYCGGHTNTITINDGPDAGLCVDTGFIVFNDRNYPTFTAFLKQLNVAERPSDMSFGFSSDKADFCYSSYVPRGLLAQKKNLLRPAFYRMVSDILRFNKQALSDFRQGLLAQKTLGDYLNEGGYSKAFVDYYVTPMGAAIWSTPLIGMLDFPAQSFVQFFSNHGLLELKNRPNWKTIPGGSHVYVQNFLKQFKGEVRTACGVKSVLRFDDGVSIDFEDGSQEIFDCVVMAAHADQTLKMLADASQEEKELLGAWSYSVNKTVLHTDVSVLPKNRNAWASWNYRVEQESSDQSPVTLTYDMNLLQGLEGHKHYLVTLNRDRPIAAEHVIREIMYTHPTYTLEAFQSQSKLDQLNGKRGTYFCGSYFGYGFHEDGAKSGVQVAKHFGMDL